MTLLPYDDAHVAIHLTHGRAFIGHGETPEAARADAERKAQAFAARETARTIGLTVVTLSMIVLLLHLLTP